MDGDGSCFSIPSTSDFPKGQDASDVSWADMFLDGIHSDDPGTSEAGSISSDTSGLGANIHGGAQQLVHQTQPNVMGGHLQIHIPTNLQGSLTSNAVQQGGTNLCGTVAYLTPSVSTQQQVGNVGRIRNMVAVTGQPHFTTSVGQPQHQGSAKLLQIAPSFPMTSVQPLTSSVPIQTLIQPNQTLTGQTIYGSQGTGLFPAQGSVHIENPKVVNVNFGPHVIGSDGSGQQAIIQTAEGKRVLITNSQVQHMSQPISLTQPLVGTQLISSAGGNVIRASMPSGTHTIVPANATGTRQIVLPTGQTMIPRQAGTTQSGIAKNVVISNLNQNMSPVIYQSGQTGQLIHSQPTLIASSGSGLQVVNTGGSQGGQVQLITQPSLNQASMGQQQLNQSTIMNLINNSSVIPGTGNQITGLVPGQNIFVNGQMLNIGQLGGLTVPQLQVQHNTQGGMTLANLNATVTHAAQFQPTAQQLVIQQNGQQHQILLQPKNSQSPSLTANVPSQRLSSGLQGTKSIATPTSSANSASSTPVPTPTPTPTPDLTSDSCDSGGKTCHGINILEQALALSAIDLQSFEDDFKFLENTDFPAIKTPPPPPPQPKIQPTKSKSKPSKARPKIIQPNVNMTVNNTSVSFQQPSAQFQNAQGQKVTVSPQQKIITASGQVFVLSANGQQFILQPSTTAASPVVPQLQPVNSVASVAGSINRTSISIPSSSQLQELNHQVVDQSSYGSKIGDDHKHSPLSVTVPTQQKATFAMVSTRANKIFLKTSPESAATFKLESALQSVPSSELVFTTMSNMNSPQDTISQTSSNFNQAQMLQLKNQKITTLSGTFFKQEPPEMVVKQEPSTELHPAVSSVQTTPNVVASTMNLPHATLTATTSNVIAMNAPLISSASFTSTTTTQSHQVTIMSTAQVTGTWTTSAPVAGTYPTYSLTSNDKQSSVAQPQSTTTLIHSGSSIPSVITCTSAASSKSNSKEKDPANIKSMIPIKIADSTLMLSLTPVQKERLENEISRMSREDQKGLLLHQQNIFRRTQKVQQKQMEQQLKQQHEKQQMLLQQQLQQQHVQQSPEFEQLQRDVIGQSQQQQLTHSPALKLSLPAQIASRPELMSPQAGHTMLGLPTTVQELEKSDERDLQLNFQSFAPKSQDQAKQISQTSQLQQSQLPPIQQQQIHSSLPPRAVALSHSMGSVQQFVIPQMGRCLAEQQLLRDRSLALSPDVNTPFKSLSDAMRRLVRYHTLQDHKPEDGSKTTRIWDTRYSKLCDYLMKKKRYYMRRFNKMKLYHDMCQHKRPEYIQNLKCFNEQLQELLESEKEKAKNHPDLFEPVRPGILSYGNDCLANSGDVSNEKKMIVDNIEETHRHSLKMEDITVKEITTDPDTSSEQSISSNASVSAKIRKIPDKGSTGTLKLVFTRRTTDNFIVKKSLTDMSEIPQDFKPMVNLKKSDSEYEFDPQTSVNCNQPVIVRRRTVSIASRQTLSDESSDSSSSVSSRVDKVQDHSSVEEDMEEEVDQNNDEREEDEDMQDEEEDDTNDEDDKSSGDEEEEQFIEGGRCSRNGYQVSFEDQVGENDNNDSCGVNTDAFMEAEEITDNEDVHQFKTVAPDVPGQSFLTYDNNHGSSTEKHQGEKKSSQCLPHTGSLTSHVFNSSLTYSSTDPALAKRPNEYDDISQVVKRVHQPVFAFEANTGQVTSSYGQNPRTASSAQVEEFISGSPVSSMEREAASKGLPGSALFTTPNKNLLETDDMFNSDDEVDLRGSRRMVSTFEIDNKDPQSSMISDSVRSAINSVLGGDEDDDDDNDDCNEGSQTSWAASTRIRSSSVHHSLYQSSSATSSVSHSHDVDLDVAVQTILNNQ